MRSRFNFGSSTDSTLLNNGSFVQLLSITNKNDAWADFLQTRALNSLSFPPEIDVSAAVSFIQSTTASSSSVPPPSTSADAGEESGSLHDVPSGKLVNDLAAGNPVDTTHILSLVKEYGMAALGLLAGNIVVGVALCYITLVACSRSRKMQSKSLSPSYAPVQFKDVERVSEDVLYED